MGGFTKLTTEYHKHKTTAADFQWVRLFRCKNKTVSCHPRLVSQTPTRPKKLNLTKMKSETDLKREGSLLEFGESIQEGDTHIHVVCGQAGAFGRGIPKAGLQVGRGSERHASPEPARIWGPPVHPPFPSGGRGYLVPPQDRRPPAAGVLRCMSAPGLCAQEPGRGDPSPSRTAASGSFFSGQSPQPQLSPHEKSEVAGSRDLRGRPDARAAGKPGGGSGASGGARLGVREAGAMVCRFACNEILLSTPKERSF